MDFPGGTVDKTPPASMGNTGRMPGLGRATGLRAAKAVCTTAAPARPGACAPSKRSHCRGAACTPQPEEPRSPQPEEPRSPQPEEPCSPQPEEPRSPQPEEARTHAATKTQHSQVNTQEADFHTRRCIKSSTHQSDVTHPNCVPIKLR